MKKKILIIIVMAASHLYTLGQCEDCYEDQGISTNPTNPENCEVDEEYPNKTNQMLNSFDWAKTSVPNPPPGTTFSFNSIPLNPDAGWLIPDFTSSGVYIMESPYEQGYLSKPSGTPLADFDFAWEDGWELMYMNTGYFPNHTGANPSVYHDPNQNNNPMVPSPIGLKNPKVPYIILYNRYTGKLRTFFNVYAELGTFDDIKLDLGYLNTTATDNVSGIFRHGNGYDLPLDQQTATKAFSTSFVNGNNVNSWFMADAQLGYDPCVCNYASEFRFRLNGLDSTRISLYGRSISSEVPLQGADGKPTYNNWLNMNTTDAALGSDGSGALIYKSLDGMLDDYKEELVKYKDNLNEYNSLGNQAQRAMIGLGKSALNAGTSGFVPEAVLAPLLTNAVGIIGSADYDGLSYNYTNTNAKFKALDKDISKNLKSTVGTMSDALFTSFITSPSKPVKPSMPMATLTEMKIEGSMYDLTNVDIGKLYTPGSFKFGGSFSPSSYPIYNEPVGLFAVLETPSFGAFKASSYKNDQGLGGYLTKDWYENELIFKLTSPLKYRFNHTVDFDFEKTQLYGQVQIVYIKTTNGSNSGFSEEGNLKVLSDVDADVNNEQDRNKMTLTTDWIPIERFGEFAHGIDWRNEILVANQPWHLARPADSILKMTFKVMADMYFDSPGFNGSEKNTTQVFTYLLYDSRNNIDFIEEKGEWLSDPSSISKYKLGTLTLEDEVIETIDDFVTEVIGTDIYVNAEKIELKGNITVQSGYNAVLQAYWGVESDPTTEIGQNIEMGIKRDFYNFPETVEVDDTELGNYCTGSSKKYQANQAKAKRTIETPNKEKPEIDYTFIVYPNPSSNLLNVKSDIENGTVDLLNVDGKVISSFELEGYKASHNVSGISSGLYFVRLATPNGFKYLRFVKQ